MIKKRLENYAIKYKSVKVMKLVGYLIRSEKIYNFLKKKGKLDYYTTVKMTKLKIVDKKWKIRLI